MHHAEIAIDVFLASRIYFIQITSSKIITASCLTIEKIVIKVDHYQGILKKAREFDFTNNQVDNICTCEDWKRWKEVDAKEDT